MSPASNTAAPHDPGLPWMPTWSLRMPCLDAPPSASVSSATRRPPPLKKSPQTAHVAPRYGQKTPPAAGTRSSDGRVLPFKSGVEFLVRRSKATVVPIGIDGTHRAYPRKAWFPRPKKVVVRVGEPWTWEQVLAEGGVEALRREVAQLAGCELAEPRARRSEASHGKAASSSGAAEVDPDNTQSSYSASTSAPPARPQNQPVDGGA